MNATQGLGDKAAYAKYAERYKVETLANARKFQLETEAAGTASAAKATLHRWRLAAYMASSARRCSVTASLPSSG